MKLPRSLSNIIDSFEKLPGIGPKTAERLGFYLLRVPQSQLEEFADALTNLKKLTKLCSTCKNTDEIDPCSVCSDSKRNKESIMVVEEPLDILSIEKSGKFNGVYHVLHGSISPLENIGPDELFIEDLIKRAGTVNGHVVKEVIIATNPTMEGDATAMYISKRLKEKVKHELKVTRLGMGIPTGADLGYADEATLREAILGRREI
jgi:recombination protein RecR